MSESVTTANSKLGKGSEARGRLSGSGSIEIHGALGGEVDWQGLLLIGVDGRLAADGRVGTLDLRGILEGRLDAKGIDLASSRRVTVNMPHGI